MKVKVVPLAEVCTAFFSEVSALFVESAGFLHEASVSMALMPMRIVCFMMLAIG